MTTLERIRYHIHSGDWWIAYLECFNGNAPEVAQQYVGDHYHPAASQNYNGYGYGYGYGYGNGNGYGYGNGNGNGYGKGKGNGNGYGNGYGEGASGEL